VSAGDVFREELRKRGFPDEAVTYIDVPPPPPPAEEDVMAQALALALLATEDTGNERCVQKEAVFYLPYHKALLPGHIYSDAGLREFKISHCCEYHFDEWVKEEDE
jgi:hypothetical protein